MWVIERLQALSLWVTTGTIDQTCAERAAVVISERVLRSSNTANRRGAHC
jgi:hypothetical protein